VKGHGPPALALLLAASPVAADRLPDDATAYLEQRALCDHFLQEPWPEEASAEARARRAFLGGQVERFCTGIDEAGRELRRRYRDRPEVLDSLEGAQDIDRPPSRRAGAGNPE
jgi:hypothetical protein